MKWKNIVRDWYRRIRRGPPFYAHKTSIIYHRSNLVLTETSHIHEYVVIRAPVARLVIGSNSHIGPHCVVLTGSHGIEIGANVMIAPHCVLAEGSHEFRNLSLPMLLAGDFSKGPIIIEDDVWIGANTTVLHNVRIGHGAVVGANSLVNRDVAPYEIVGGVPVAHIDTRLKYRTQ